MEVIVIGSKNSEQLNKYSNFLENINNGSSFTIKGGRIFIKGPQIRKRIKCKEISTGKYYLFSPVYPVIISPTASK